MNVVETCRISGKGEALITDEPFQVGDLKTLRSKKKVRVATDGRVVTMDVLSVEAVLKAGGLEFLCVLVPFFPDVKLRTAIVNRHIDFA